MARARVQELTQIIVSDIQPLQTKVFLDKLDRINSDHQANRDLIKHYIRRGLTRYEQQMDQTSRFSIGEQISVADIVLYAQCQNLSEFDIECYQGVQRIYKLMDSILGKHPDQN